MTERPDEEDNYLPLVDDTTFYKTEVLQPILMTLFGWSLMNRQGNCPVFLPPGYHSMDSNKRKVHNDYFLMWDVKGISKFETWCRNERIKEKLRNIGDERFYQYRVLIPLLKAAGWTTTKKEETTFLLRRGKILDTETSESKGDYFRIIPPLDQTLVVEWCKQHDYKYSLLGGNSAEIKARAMDYSRREKCFSGTEGKTNGLSTACTDFPDNESKTTDRSSFSSCENATIEQTNNAKMGGIDDEMITRQQSREVSDIGTASIRPITPIYFVRDVLPILSELGIKYVGENCDMLGHEDYPDLKFSSILSMQRHMLRFGIPNFRSTNISEENRELLFEWVKFANIPCRNMARFRLQLKSLKILNDGEATSLLRRLGFSVDTEGSFSYATSGAGISSGRVSTFPSLNEVRVGIRSSVFGNMLHNNGLSHGDQLKLLLWAALSPAPLPEYNAS